MTINIEDFDEFVIQFTKEGHRAAVILGTARIDDLLALILQKYLLPKRGRVKDKDELLYHDRPLGTLNAKINLSYRLGLIDEDFTKILHLIRDIRNDFAHVIDANLEKPPILDKVKDLVQKVNNSKFFEDVRNNYFKDVKPHIVNDFYVVLIMVAMQLQCLEEIIDVPLRSPAALLPKDYIV